MNISSYHKYYDSPNAKNFSRKVCKKLQTESVVTTCIPEVGERSFLRTIQEIYHTKTKDNKTVIAHVEIIPAQTKIVFIASKINEELNYALGFPPELQDLSCESTIKEILKKGKSILIILNRFERLKESPETMTFLDSLRSLNSFKIRFLIGCDYDFLLYPKRYQNARFLSTANLFFLPTSDMQKLKHSVELFRTLWGWNVPKKHLPFLMKMSGGIPGLYMYMAKFIYDEKLKDPTLQDLLSSPTIQQKLTIIIDNLISNGLIKKNKLNLDHSDLLKKLGVIDSKGEILAAVIKNYFHEKENSATAKKNYLEQHLSAQEMKLYEFLKDNKNRLVTLDEISSRLWGEQIDTKFSQWSMYKTISNLNKKLKKTKVEIRNLRGRGYQLSEFSSDSK